MAWFRPMGADEVAYHQATVVGRDDDHPGAALDYYGSRGETPLRWGGAGAARLGLVGEVTPDAYEAAFGPGGFRDPATGGRLVVSKRPGFELVVSAHKSVAVLGVIDRADAMHSILDVETDATMDWLDDWFQEPRRAAGARAVPHRDRRADLRRDPARHLKGGRSVAARPRAGGQRRRDARPPRRAQGPRQRRAAGHGRSGHDGRPAPLRGASGRARLRDRTGHRGRRGTCGTGASSVSRPRCATCSPSAATRSPSTWPPPAVTATGPEASPPGRPARPSGTPASTS